jgi:hypothetical protein
MLLALAVFYGLWVLRRELLGRRSELIPQVGRRAWKGLQRITVDQLVDMLWLRLSSVVTLTASIFMKRIRAMGYARLYEDPKYRARRVSNLVYHLQSSEPFAESLAGLVSRPSAALRRVADVAASMPTTLWFDPDKPYQLPCLVAAGQATLCYNLMKQLVREQGRDPARFPPEVGLLWGRLVADWEGLMDDPYSLLRKRELGRLLEPGSPERP